MNNVRERTSLAAQISQLQRMLSDIGTASPIARLSIESRLEELKSQMEALYDDGIHRARVELTFKGFPVHATQGVEARFAAMALDKYDSNDEELVEAASQVDHRTMMALREFLETVGQHHACFTVRCDDQIAEFPDVASVTAAAERLDEKNISESDVPVPGYLLGVLPGKRFFEIQPADGANVIFGKLDSGLSVEQVKELESLKSKKITFHLHTLRVGRVRFATRYGLRKWETPGDSHSENV